MVSPAAPDHRQILGVDYGTVRIGLALGDPRTGLVVPLPVMENPGEDAAVAAKLAEVARGHDVARVVLGDPIHLSGTESKMSRVVGRIRDMLSEQLEVPVLLRDERLTSADAEARLRATGLRWWQYDKGKLDALAAMTIVRDLLLEENPSLGLTAGDDEPDGPVGREKPAAKRRRKEARRRARKRDD